MSKHEDQNKSKNQNSFLKKFLYVIWGLLIVALIVLGGYLYKHLNDLKYDNELENPDQTVIDELDNPEEPVDTNLPTAEVQTPIPTNEPDATQVPELTMKNNSDYGIINIAVFGLDNRYKNSLTAGRSDVNMILTIDSKNNEIRLTTIMRDTLINIPAKKDMNRINSAIVYEKGPEGAIAAIEKEFLIDIDHFVVSSFRGVSKIIDAVGGVDINLSQQEVWDMNGLIQEMNRLYGYSKNKGIIQSKGNHRLNGLQAVAYMRIRHSDGVFKRASRQQEVLASVRNSLSNVTVSELDNIMKTVTKYIKTDLEPLEFLNMTKKLYDLRNAGYKTSRVPYDDHYKAVRYKKMAVLQYDKDYTLKELHKFIYGSTY
jgi:LCP family protein required for cell wall assembly